MGFYLRITCPECPDHAGELDCGVSSKNLNALVPGGEPHVLDNAVHHGTQCGLCGKSYKVLVRKTPNGQLDLDYIRRPEGDRGRQWVLLELNLDPGERLFARLDRTHGASRYWFEEGTCPTNFLDEIEELYVVDKNGRVTDDPHGIFNLLGWTPNHGNETNEQHAREDERWLGVVEVIASGRETLLPLLLPPE